MGVHLEFSVPAAGFRLGEVLSGTAGMRLELERVVPVGEAVTPFDWATGSDHSTFEANVNAHPAVEELIELDALGNKRLYRITWNEAPTDLLKAIADAGGSVLRAHGDDGWWFRLRFEDHEAVSQFHDEVVDRGITLHVDRTYSPSEATDPVDRFDLTDGQREALLLALEQGYFATPRQTGLDELADDLDVTRQAVSKRIRRGNETVLHSVLSSAIEDTDEHSRPS